MKKEYVDKKPSPLLSRQHVSSFFFVEPRVNSTALPFHPISTFLTQHTLRSFFFSFSSQIGTYTHMSSSTRSHSFTVSHRSRSKSPGVPSRISRSRSPSEDQKCQNHKKLGIIRKCDAPLFSAHKVATAVQDCKHKNIQWIWTKQLGPLKDAWQDVAFDLSLDTLGTAFPEIKCMKKWTKLIPERFEPHALKMSFLFCGTEPGDKKFNILNRNVTPQTLQKFMKLVAESAAHAWNTLPWEERSNLFYKGVLPGFPRSYSFIYRSLTLDEWVTCFVFVRWFYTHFYSE